MIDDSKDYVNQMDENSPFYDLYLKDYLKRLEDCRSKGVHTVMLTGNSEPQQNRHFLKDFGLMMMLMKDPFKNIEMQTTGVMLDDNYLRFLRNHVGVSTISVSLSSFDDDLNAEIVGMPKGLKVDVADLCRRIKKYDFNLRLSINLSDAFEAYTPFDLFKTANNLEADQITFRVLYGSGKDTPQDIWIKDHLFPSEKVEEINAFIKSEQGDSEAIEILPYGQKKYFVMGMSTVLDDDCMSTALKEDLKYAILRQNCKLYSKWDKKALMW